MMDAENVRLGEICTIQYGFAFNSKKFTEDDSKIPLIRIRDVKRGFSNTYYDGPFSSEYLVHKGDLLVGMDGEFNIARWKSQDALLNQRVCKIVANSNVDEEYLRFYLKRALKDIENKTSFVTVKHLSAKKLSNLVIKLPKKNIQISISKQLSFLESLIHNFNEENVLFDELVKARFVEMFGDCTNMISLSELCLIITDGTHQSPKFQHDGIPFILVSNLSKNTVTYDTDKFISAETYKELYKRTPIEIGDILLSTVGSYGHPAVVVEDRKFLFQRHIAYLKPKSDILNSYYMHGALLSPGCQRQIEEKVKGIAQKTLNLSEIRKIRIPVSSLDLQKQYADFVHQVNKSKVAVQKALDETQILFDSLMQKYFG